jgi:Acyl-CoA synthetases (AMP-forming)/AMP-acid ligases II
MSVKYYDWAKYHANFRPNKIAIKDTSLSKEQSYLKLNENASRFAKLMQEKGIKKGDRVSLLSFNCIEFFELLFACGKIGAVLVPLNWRLTEPELNYIVSNCSPKIFIYDNAFSEISSNIINSCGIEIGIEINPNEK